MQFQEITWLLIVIISILITLNDEVLSKKRVSDKKLNQKETKKFNQDKQLNHHNKQVKKNHSKHNLNKGHPGNHTTKVSQRPAISINKILITERCPLTRIIGGYNLTEGKLPYTAVYYICTKPHENTVNTNKDCHQWCGGSIISKYHILTVAHCLHENNKTVPPANVVVRVGYHDLKKPETNATTLQVSEIFLHKDFSSRAPINDIALIKVKNEITFTELVQPICINGIHCNKNNHFTSLVAGWGVTEQGGLNSKELKAAKLTIYSYPECKVNENESLLHFCAHSASTDNGIACNGDSGSGLVYMDSNNSPWNILLGLACTSGQIVNNAPVCGNPMTFTNVSSYAEWINEHAAK